MVTLLIYSLFYFSPMNYLWIQGFTFYCLWQVFSRSVKYQLETTDLLTMHIIKCLLPFLDTDGLMNIKKPRSRRSYAFWRDNKTKLTAQRPPKGRKRKNDMTDINSLIWDKIWCQIPHGLWWTGRQLLPLCPNACEGNLNMFRLYAHRKTEYK